MKEKLYTISLMDVFRALAMIVLFIALLSGSGKEVRAEETKFRIGIGTLDAEEESPFFVLGKNLEVLEKLAEVKFEDTGEIIGSSTEASVYNVKRQIEEGVDGILICPPADSVLPGW